jgi:hypothetical protein
MLENTHTHSRPMGTTLHQTILSKFQRGGGTLLTQTLVLTADEVASWFLTVMVKQEPQISLTGAQDLA